MFVLMSSTGPVVVLATRASADSWADRFGWTVHEVPCGDEVQPMKLKTGFMNLLEPMLKPTYRESFVSFLPEEQSNFPDAEKVNVGDVFHKSNLENLFFSIPEEVNANELALKFWNRLKARGIDLQRQVNDKFLAVRNLIPNAS